MWAIDFGTTNTAIARWVAAEERPQPVLLPEICRSIDAVDPLQAPPVVPTAVHVLEPKGMAARLANVPFFERRFLPGRLAYIGRQAVEANETRVSPAMVRSFKPYLGHASTRPVARVGSRRYSVREVTRLFIRELFHEIRESTSERVRELAVTTPVDAFESYRAELARLFRGVGVRKLRFLDEPVAAALGYGLGLERERLVLVVDFGGGTLDVALVHLSAKGIEKGRAEVLGKEGRPLGGDLVDRWLLEDCFERLDLTPPEDVSAGLRASLDTRMLLLEARKAKEGLFFSPTQTLALMELHDMARFSAHLKGQTDALSYSRDQLVSLLERRGAYEAVDDCIQGVFDQARDRGITMVDVDEVLMVGGSTLLPGVYPRIESQFSRDKVRAWQPFEAVAHGAAAFSAGKVQQQDFIVHDYAFVTHDLDSHEKRYSVVVPHGTRFPTTSDFWTRQVVPTCSLGDPETMFKLIICEVGSQGASDRRFSWDAQGSLHRLGGEGAEGERFVVALNESNPTLGYLKPPHAPDDRRPRLQISFGINSERWLVATVVDLFSKKTMLSKSPVVRLV